MRLIIIYLTLKHNNNWGEIYDAINHHEKMRPSELITLQKAITKNKWDIATIIDKNYPAKAKEQINPPFTIFNNVTWQDVKKATQQDPKMMWN